MIVVSSASEEWPARVRFDLSMQGADHLAGALRGTLSVHPRGVLSGGRAVAGQLVGVQP